MSVLTEIVEGWSGALPFTLNADGTPVDLTGMTVHIVLRSSTGYTPIKDTTAGIVVSTSETGRVSYAPATSSGNLFLASKTPYSVRFRVTDALTRIVYFPNGDDAILKVNRP